jgi:lipopolysaccharide biosynthesis glycosyltransferase
MNEPLRVFIGCDSRQPVALTVAAHSVARHSTKPVAITPLMLHQLPITRRGLTEFTYARWLTPWLCNFKGKALFMDADMIVRGDIAELFEYGGMNAVSVMQEQERFEWPSMMLFNCAACHVLTPEYVEDPKNKLFPLDWAPYVGELPSDWNHCVSYMDPLRAQKAKLIHYTAGLPVWEETQGNPEDDYWFKELEHANSTCSYNDLMAKSVHHERVIKPKLEVA